MQDKEQEPKYRCPICGYFGLDEADPNSGTLQFLGFYEICPCCGAEFGSDIDADSIDELKQSIYRYRMKWINEGHNWFSDYDGPPIDWDWKRELREIGIDVDDI